MHKHTEIENNGGRLMGYVSKHDGHFLLHRNHHPGVPIFERGRPIREEQVDEHDVKS